MHAVEIYMIWVMIGIHALAIFLSLRVAFHKNTKTSPYLCFIAALLIILILRFDNLYHFLPKIFRLTIQMLASIAFFMYAYRMLKELRSHPLL